MSLKDMAKDVAAALLRRRAVKLGRHYKRVFMPEGQLSRDAEIVLADLRDQCFFLRTTRDDSDAVMREREALRRLFLRIARLLDVSDAEIKAVVEIDYGPEFASDD